MASGFNPPRRIDEVQQAQTPSLTPVPSTAPASTDDPDDPPLLPDDLTDFVQAEISATNDAPSSTALLSPPMSPPVTVVSNESREQIAWKPEVLSYLFDFAASAEFKPFLDKGRIRKPGYVHLTEKLKVKFPNIKCWTWQRVKDRVQREKSNFVNQTWARKKLSGAGVDPKTGDVVMDDQVLGEMSPAQREKLQAKCVPEAAAVFEGGCASGGFTATTAEQPNDPTVKLETSELEGSDSKQPLPPWCCCPNRIDGPSTQGTCSD